MFPIYLQKFVQGFHYMMLPSHDESVRNYSWPDCFPAPDLKTVFNEYELKMYRFRKIQIFFMKVVKNFGHQYYRSGHGIGENIIICI